MPQNMCYIMKKWWDWDRKNLFLSFLRVPALVLIPFLGVLLPKAVLDCLSGEPDPLRLTLTVGGFTVALCLLYWMERTINGRIYTLGISYRMSFLDEMIVKYMDTDYENIESSDGQKKLRKAWNFTQSDSSGGQAFLEGVIQFFVNVLGLALYAAILSTLHPLVVLLLAILSLLVYLATRAVSRYEFRNRDQWTPLEQKLWYLYDTPDDPRAAKDIRLYRIQNWFSQLFHSILPERMVWQRRVALRWFGVGGLEGFLNFLRDGAAYAYLIFLVLNGSISPSDFVLFFGAVTGFSVWMTGITTQLGVLTRVSLGCCDYRDYLEMPDHFPEEGAAPLTQDMKLPEIVFDHVTFRYPGAEKTTLEEVSFRVKPGEKIALVGINGAGKTTCIKLLCGLYRPTMGRILINGIDISEMNRDEYFGLIAAVFQEANFMPFTIAENVAACEETQIDYDRVKRCIELAGLRGRIERLPNGVQTLMDKSVNEEAATFSGGEQQKLLLARALYKDAPILILDEPTAALDPIAENELYQRYGELTEGRTSFFISHRLSSTRFCDRILFLENGRITEEGAHAELMALGGHYAYMFEVQSHYYKKQAEEGESL